MNGIIEVTKKSYPVEVTVNECIVEISLKKIIVEVNYNKGAIGPAGDSAPPNVFGTVTEPTLIEPGDNIPFSGSSIINYGFFTVDSPLSISAVPRIAPGLIVGQEYTIECDSIHSITISDDDLPLITGVDNVGDWVSSHSSVITYFWNGIVWKERNRR